MQEAQRWNLIQAALDGEELERLTDRASQYLSLIHI